MTLPTPNAAFHWSREPWGTALRSRRLDAIAQHLFTSRQLEFPSDQAWRDAVASLGGSTALLMRVKQVHGNVVRGLTTVPLRRFAVFVRQGDVYVTGT